MRHLGLAVLAVFILLPLVQAVLLSFTATLPTDAGGRGHAGTDELPQCPDRARTAAAMVNSLVYVTLNVALCISMGCPPPMRWRAIASPETGISC